MQFYLRAPFCIILILFLIQPTDALACTARNESCAGKEICVFSLYALNDSHIAQCGYYTYSLCCDLQSATLRGSQSARENCLENEEGIAALYAANDTHEELYSSGNYNYTICVTPHVRCSKKPACGANETALFSVFNGTDSHIGTPDYYDEKICCFDRAPDIFAGTYRANSTDIAFSAVFNRSEIVIIRANITDSSGEGDLETALITIRSPLNGTKIYEERMANISSIENGTMYEYNFTRTKFARLGNWSATVRANDSFGNAAAKDIYFEIARNSSELWVVNSLINVVFSATGISSLQLNDSELLEEGIDLLASGLPNITVYPTIARISFANGVLLKIYDRLSKVVVYSNHSFSPVIGINSTFTYYYNESENSFNSSGEQFNTVLNMTSIYTGTRTITVIGRDLNISVYNTTHKEIRLYNVTEFEIYVHPGTYETSIAEKNLYLNPPATLIGLPALINGIAEKRMDELASLPQSEVQRRVGAGIGYNITVDNETTSIGKQIPDNRDVIVISKPTTLIGRLGNITKTYINIALWVGGDNR